MITGAHVILYSTDADADRAFLQNLLGTTTVDAGGGWLILALPPGEVAVHPSDGPQHHELYLLCDDIEATMATLRSRGVEFTKEVSDAGWGLLSALRLPDGSELPIYQPKHPVATGAS